MSLIEKIALKPCPFCGNTELTVEHMEGTIVRPAYRVLCDHCGASSRYSDTDHVGAWNNRAALTAIMGAGDGVQEVDRELAYFIAGRSAREADFEQARRHRSTAAAAERARIVAWLRDSFASDWPRTDETRRLADAIERGEV